MNTNDFTRMNANI